MHACMPTWPCWPGMHLAPAADGGCARRVHASGALPAWRASLRNSSRAGLDSDVASPMRTGLVSWPSCIRRCREVAGRQSWAHQGCCRRRHACCRGGMQPGGGGRVENMKNPKKPLSRAQARAARWATRARASARSRRASWPRSSASWAASALCGGRPPAAPTRTSWRPRSGLTPLASSAGSAAACWARCGGPLRLGCLHLLSLPAVLRPAGPGAGAPLAPAACISFYAGRLVKNLHSPHPCIRDPSKPALRHSGSFLPSYESCNFQLVSHRMPGRHLRLAHACARRRARARCWSRWARAAWRCPRC
jgi:hypothetical protein